MFIELSTLHFRNTRQQSTMRTGKYPRRQKSQNAYTETAANRAHLWQLHSRLSLFFFSPDASDLSTACNPHGNFSSSCSQGPLETPFSCTPDCEHCCKLGQARNHVSRGTSAVYQHVAALISCFKTTTHRSALMRKYGRAPSLQPRRLESLT